MNGGKSDIIDTILKILDKEREALANVNEEEIDSNTGAMEKAFKTLAENLLKDFAKVKCDIEEVRNGLMKIDKGMRSSLTNEIDISKTDNKLRDMYKAREWIKFPHFNGKRKPSSV